MSLCFFPSDISAFSHLARALPPRKGRKTTAVKTDGRNSVLNERPKQLAGKARNGY